MKKDSNIKHHSIHRALLILFFGFLRRLPVFQLNQPNLMAWISPSGITIKLSTP